MSTLFTPNLLRRTAVALAAAAGLAVSLPVLAQSNALKKSTGETICTYSQLAVTPTGGIMVTCDSTTTSPPPVVTNPPEGTFTISGPSSLGPNSAANFTLTRNNGSSGQAFLPWTVTGGCAPASGSMQFNSGGSIAGNISISTPSTNATCVVALGTPSIGVLGSPSSITVSVGGGSTSTTLPPPTTQPGCPTPPSDVLDFELKLSGADILRMGSGRIAAAVLPKISDTRSSGSGKVIFGESTIAPRAATVEVSITKCRGVIDTNGGTCYLRSTSVSFMKQEWIERALWGDSTDAVVASYGVCKAYQTDGTFYVNVRYTYSPENCQWGECGLVNQWNYGSF